MNMLFEEACIDNKHVHEHGLSLWFEIFQICNTFYIIEKYTVYF